MGKTRLTSIFVILGSLIVASCGSGGLPGKNVAPIISVEAPASAAEGTTVNVTVNADDPDGSIRQILWERTFGPNIDFGGTDSLSTAIFTAPEVDKDTTLGLLVLVIDDDGAVAQEFIEIIITDSLKLKHISAKTNSDGQRFELVVELDFDKEPLLNSLIDYSNNCNGGIAFSINRFNSCMSYTTEQSDTRSLVLKAPLKNLSNPIQMEISGSLVSVLDNHFIQLVIEDILDETVQTKLNEKLNQ